MNAISYHIISYHIRKRLGHEMDLFCSFWEVLPAKRSQHLRRIKIPTLNKTVSLKIPQGTPSGQSFKVKGEGISPQGRRSGDLYVRVSIKPPSKLSKSGKKKLEEFRDEGYEGAPEEYRGYLYE